jgi:mono/diheme cytochrome c family protein
MKCSRALFAPLALVSLFVLGCGEDVGKCDDPNRGHDTVEVNGQLQFGGQAIINASCAGCHGSQVKGAARRGAPAGLDFDLYPVAESEADGMSMNKDGDPIVTLTPDQVDGLRERQRLVFEERDLIWEQVKDELMPPNGLGEVYRALMGLVDTDDEEPCTRRKQFKAITEKSSQDVLRNWLACGAPIVESQGADVTKELTAGQAGYQYPMCEGDAPPEVITLDVVHEQVLSSCTVCHSAKGKSPPFFETPDEAYDVLVDQPSTCDDLPYITPGKPEESFLYDKVANEKPQCGARMPIGMALPASQLELLEKWIAGGAKRSE